MSEIKELPTKANPGSDDAVLFGCLCPVTENKNGTGAQLAEDGTPLFYIFRDCPLHGFKSRRKNS